MVGLPARGKSYISKAIIRYLNFMGCSAQLFNAGDKRRQEGQAGVEANFFDASNLDAKAQRERMAMETLDELLYWVQGETGELDGCACGIFDATNTTISRREKVRERIAAERPVVKLVFIELICNDEIILDNNYRMKLSNDDYKGQDPAAALADFKERVRQYELVYEPIDDDLECRPLKEALTDGRPGIGREGSLRTSGSTTFCDALLNVDEPPKPGCVKMIDGGRKLVVTQCEGFVVGELLSLLHSIHLGPRCVFITLVGETENDAKGLLGGDSSLSAEGLAYARAVKQHLLRREAQDRDLDLESSSKAMVLTGTLRRNVQMAEVLCDDTGDEKRVVMQLHRLNELCAGTLDSLTYDQIKAGFPAEFAARSGDKLNYRYPGPGGESYMDLIMRLGPVILMLEQTRGNVVVTCDRAACRVLLAYFEGLSDTAELPFIDVKPGIIELRRSHSGFSHTHTPITSGAATSAAGPGTHRAHMEMPVGGPKPSEGLLASSC